MEVQELIKEILSPQHKALYVISTQELFFIDKLVQTIQDQFLDKDFQEFNQAILHGKDMNANNIIDQAREFPFFGNQKLIIVKEAQDVKDWEPLVGYAKHLNKSTLLIICFSKKPDGRSVWVKQIKDLGFFIEIKPLSDYQLPAFIKSAIKELQIDMDEESQLLLMDSIGNELSTIYNELEKLKLNIVKGHKVSKDDINKYIGISKEFNVFELQKAISLRDHRKIYWICKNMSQHIKTHRLFTTVGALFAYFQKIWITKVYNKMNDVELNKLLKLPYPNFIKEYRTAAASYSLDDIERTINLLKEYDLKSKGLYQGNTREEDLYLELALKINQL